MCHEFLTHPLLFFSLSRLCFSAFLGFDFQPFSAALICFFYRLHEVIPKVVASAVSTLIAICRIVFQVSFFILFSF